MIPEGEEDFRKAADASPSKPFAEPRQSCSSRRICLLYHYFYPDDVISARLFSDLAEGLTHAGYEVLALSSSRSCHSNSIRYPKHELWQGGTIQRIWRPNFRQSSNLGRILNSLFILCGWAWQAALYRRSKREVQSETVIIGTDPIFGVLAAIPWRIFRPRARIIHWCHDLHPEASIAEGSVSPNSVLVRSLRWLLRRAYRRCDAVIDLGSCMRHLLAKAGGWDGPRTDSNCAPVLETITPWSLVEPAGVLPVDGELRKKLFGDCQLALLYSGNLGRAHDFRLLLDLARKCRNQQIHFCFAGRGPGMDWLVKQITVEDSNISTAGFADEAELQARLAACDIHLVSLKDDWTGTVVPSKFFGALSIGRPVLFAGAERSCISQWIGEYRVGWHLAASTIDTVRRDLLNYAAKQDWHLETNQRCWQVYRQHFSRQVQLEKWLRLIAPDILNHTEAGR